GWIAGQVIEFMKGVVNVGAYLYFFDICWYLLGWKCKFLCAFYRLGSNVVLLAYFYDFKKCYRRWPMLLWGAFEP
uniref:Uncharacterized protein n=1 Tax=Aegilops tauschii subsp. strangulata TaxID=200361 RepID=A0A453B227_AEGTS